MSETPHVPYEEHHFSDVKDVGIAFEGRRIWVCFNGMSVLRAQVMPDGKLSVEYDPTTYDRIRRIREKGTPETTGDQGSAPQEAQGPAEGDRHQD